MMAPWYIIFSEAKDFANRPKNHANDSPYRNTQQARVPSHAQSLVMPELLIEGFVVGETQNILQHEPDKGTRKKQGQNLHINKIGERQYAQQRPDDNGEILAPPELLRLSPVKIREIESDQAEKDGDDS